MDYITVNELINVLSKLPNEVREMRIYKICGCVDGKDKVNGFQFQLKNKDGENKYILVPRSKNDIMYDTFGERKII